MAGEEDYVVDVKVDRVIDLVLSAQKSLSLDKIRSEFGDKVVSISLPIDRIIDLVLSAQSSHSMDKTRSELGSEIVTVGLPVALSIKQLSDRSDLFAGILPLDYDHCTRRAVR